LNNKSTKAKNNIRKDGSNVVEEILIRLRDKDVRIYSFTDRSLVLEDILKDEEVNIIHSSSNIYKSIVFLDKINRKDKIFNLKKALNSSDLLLINSSRNQGISHLNIETISYGIDEKSTITLSSIDDIEDDRPIICIQRSFNSLFSMEYEPMEIKMDNIYGIKDISTYVGIMSIKIVLELN